MPSNAKTGLLVITSTVSPCKALIAEITATIVVFPSPV
jgi:hypothetical protein